MACFATMAPSRGLRRLAARLRNRLVGPVVRAFRRVLLRQLLVELDAHPESAMIREIVKDTLLGPLVWGDSSRVKIADTAVVHSTLLNTVSGTIEVQDYAMIGGNVTLMTGSHDISKTGSARAWQFPLEGRDIVVEEGAWIAAHAIVLGPARIGRDAVVAAGAVVRGDVPSGAIVAGIPARVIGHISERG